MMHGNSNIKFATAVERPWPPNLSGSSKIIYLNKNLVV